jgi:uncharacterized repeat protein (TIGR01451 family)
MPAAKLHLGDYITYTLLISNQQRLPGYNLVITDVLPYSSRVRHLHRVQRRRQRGDCRARARRHRHADLDRGQTQPAVTPFNALNNTALLITVDRCAYRAT